MRNFEHCKYTYRHRRAFEYLVEKLFRKDPHVYAEMKKRAHAHDVDKLIMYRCASKPEVRKIHQAIAVHHMQNDLPKGYYDILEAIVDFESSGYTKPDKPLNAWDTIQRFQEMGADPALCTQFMALCRHYGLDSSYRVTESDPKGMEYVKQYETVTEEMIDEDIMAYFRSKI